MKAFSYRSLVAAMAMTVIAATAVAGSTTTQVVVISTSKSFAYGDLGFVRNTWDAVQSIGCKYTATWGACFATESTGLYKSCVTTDPALLEVMRSINGDSWLMFHWTADGNCSAVEVQQASVSAPK
jgi:hypothetical protein